jgi:hypothetical protein
MYIDAMQEVYANVTKVMVDTHGGNNLISLPLDKLLQAAPRAPSPRAAPGLLRFQFLRLAGRTLERHHRRTLARQHAQP